KRDDALAPARCMCEVAAHHRELVCSRSINWRRRSDGARAVMVANLSVGCAFSGLEGTQLEELVRENGAGSVAAMVLARLPCMRAKDRQVFAFQVGDYLMIGSPPNATSEARLIESGRGVALYRPRAD